MGLPPSTASDGWTPHIQFDPLVPTFHPWPYLETLEGQLRDLVQ